MATQQSERGRGQRWGMYGEAGKGMPAAAGFCRRGTWRHRRAFRIPTRTGPIADGTRPSGIGILYVVTRSVGHPLPKRKPKFSILENWSITPHQITQFLDFGKLRDHSLTRVFPVGRLGVTNRLRCRRTALPWRRWSSASSKKFYIVPWLSRRLKPKLEL